MQRSIDELDDRGTSFAEQTAINTLESCDVGHNEAFIRTAQRIALNRLLVSVLDYSSGIKKSFKHARV